jgi:hypothetical protein
MKDKKHQTTAEDEFPIKISHMFGLGGWPF